MSSTLIDCREYLLRKAIACGTTPEIHSGHDIGEAKSFCADFENSAEAKYKSARPLAVYVEDVEDASNLERILSDFGLRNMFPSVPDMVILDSGTEFTVRYVRSNVTQTFKDVRALPVLLAGCQSIGVVESDAQTEKQSDLYGFYKVPEDSIRIQTVKTAKMLWPASNTEE